MGADVSKEMMNDEDFINCYKELSANSSEKAPEGLWEAIVRKLDEDLLVQYQQQLEINREPAPDVIWDNIERELDSGLLSIYHTQISDSKQSIPIDFWDAIEMGLDEELIDQYKQQLAQRQEKAPATTWDFIRRKLDIDEVWDRISAKLAYFEKRSTWMYYGSIAAAATGLIVTIGLGAWMFFGWLNQPQVAVTNERDTAPSAVEQQADSFTEPDPLYQISPQQLATPILARIESEPEIVPVENELLVEFPENLGAVAPMAPKTPRLLLMQNRNLQNILAEAIPSHPIQANEQPGEESIIVPFGDDQFTLASGLLGFGFSAGIRNSWLFSNQTYLALTGYNGHRTKMSLFPDMALHVRYQVAPRVELETGLSFSSNVGQSYQQYIYGRFSRKDIALNYLLSEVLVNYQSRRTFMVGRNTLRLNTTFGMYFAFLNHASESIAGEKFDVSHNYKNMDYGLILGQNIDFELPANITFSPGLRLTWGIPNIHQQLPNSPEFMWRTFNRSLELRLAVFYKIPFARK